MAGVIYIQKVTLGQNKTAIDQWKRYGNTMKTRIGWSDSHLKTNVASNQDIHDKKTKAWNKPGQYKTPTPSK